MNVFSYAFPVTKLVTVIGTVGKFLSQYHDRSTDGARNSYN